MVTGLVLTGYKPSVYTWIVRLVLAQKRASARMVWVDPFAGPVVNHPFGRVPALDHNGFALYETAAITRYLDRILPDPAMTPDDAKRQARMAQVIGIADAYAYWPLVRQVFAGRVFAPAHGEPAREDDIAAGVIAARPVLAALERIAEEGLALDGRGFTLADAHLAPMIASFVQAPEGAALLRPHKAMTRWWSQARRWPALQSTDPNPSASPL